MPLKAGPAWSESGFRRLGFGEYVERWRGEITLTASDVEELAEQREKTGVYTFEQLAFETRGGLKLALALFAPFALTVFAASFWWDYQKLLRSCSIAALIGFGTNWIAVKMLFRPRAPRPLLGQGLIPSQRAEILHKVAEEVTGKLVNEEKIRREIEERQLVGRVTERALDRLRELARRPDFVADTKAMVLTFVEKLVNNPQFRERVIRVTEDRVTELAGGSVTTWLADKAREFWFGPLRPAIDRELDNLPQTLDRVLAEFEHILERLPAYLDKRKRTLEETLTRLVMAFVREVDLRGMLDRTLEQVTPEQLEQSFHDFADDKLSYITLLGGALGAVGGLIIVEPVYALGGLGVLALGLFISDAVLAPMMRSRFWPRRRQREVAR